MVSHARHPAPVREYQPVEADGETALVRIGDRRRRSDDPRSARDQHPPPVGGVEGHRHHGQGGAGKLAGKLGDQDALEERSLIDALPAGRIVRGGGAGRIGVVSRGRGGGPAASGQCRGQSRIQGETPGNGQPGDSPGGLQAGDLIRHGLIGGVGNALGGQHEGIPQTIDFRLLGRCDRLPGRCRALPGSTRVLWCPRSLPAGCRPVALGNRSAAQRTDAPLHRFQTPRL